jgi:hypothetical protein
MNSRKEIDEIFEKPDNKQIDDDDATLTETRESLMKKKRQPRKPKSQPSDINFEKEKEDFLKSLASKLEDEPKKKEVKEVKEVKVVENKERKLQLIENLKKAREQKKLNKQQPKEQPKEIVKEHVKEVVKEDPEYLEWKKQRQAKQQEQPKVEVKVEQPKQEVKVEPIKIAEVKPIQQEYIQRCTFKKPLWAK